MPLFAAAWHPTRRLIAVAVVVAFALLGVAQPVALGEVRAQQNRAPGRYIVTLVDGADMRGVRADHGVRAAAVTASYRRALHGFAATLPDHVATRLASDPRVRRVEVDRRVTSATTQSWPMSWGLDRIDERSLPLSGSYTYGTTGAGVKAYIVDSGIRRTHVDFGNRVAEGWYAPTWFTSTDDCNGHGTHVAGTVGGREFGVAKGVTLVPVKALGLTPTDEPCGTTGFPSDVIDGIDWMIEDHGPGQPAVANLSLGGTTEGADALEEAVGNAIADGITFVVAAGNEGQVACNVSPARVPDVITVGATNINDEKASFSNFGACIDLFAPGVSIWSAYSGSDTDYEPKSGTSMAAPHVAGTAARYLELKPGSTPAEVDAYLKAEATIDDIDRGPDSPNRLLYAQRPALVSIAVSRNSLTYGGSVTISGNVVDPEDGGAFDQGEIVTLQRRRAGSATWTAVESTPPSPSGDVTFTVAPTWSAYYRLRLSGGDEQLVRSSTVRVDVRPRVTSELNDATVRLGDVARLSGAVLPSHAGRSVQLQRYRDGAWRSIKSEPLNANSRYSFRLATSTRGRHRYRVVLPVHTDHVRGTSAVRTLTVD